MICRPDMTSICLTSHGTSHRLSFSHFRFWPPWRSPLSGLVRLFVGRVTHRQRHRQTCLGQKLKIHEESSLSLNFSSKLAFALEAKL